MGDSEESHLKPGEPGEVLPEALAGLSESAREAVLRLSKHEREDPDLSMFHHSKLAAVLVLLYEQGGQLKVLLTTRSKSLRSHPGQTALPGGKCDESDATLIETALREAHEEVALPRRSPHIHILCLLRPFLSLHKLAVTPVVALLTDVSILEQLHPSASEVAHVFDHPLEALLDPSLSASLDLVAKGSEDWPYETEHYHTTDHGWLGDSSYRMHRLRSSASPIKGLTADILISVAEIAYNRNTEYPRFTTNQAKDWKDTHRILTAHLELEQQAGQQKVKEII